MIKIENIDIANGINLRRLVPGSNLPFIRSGCVGRFVDADVKKLHHYYDIKSYIDFRTFAEIDILGQPIVFLKSCIDYISFPIDNSGDKFFSIKKPSPQDYGEFYIRMFPNALEALKKLVQLYLKLRIDDRKIKIMFGCNGGKDRTGIVSLLMLVLLEYPLEIIIEDYLVSGKYIEDSIEYFAHMLKPKSISHEDYLDQMRPKTLSANIFLDYLKSIDVKKKFLDSYRPFSEFKNLFQYRNT